MRQSGLSHHGVAGGAVAMGLRVMRDVDNVQAKVDVAPRPRTCALTSHAPRAAHSRGCWRNAHNPRPLMPFIPFPLAAYGKAYLECRLTGEHGTAAALCSAVHLACVRAIAGGVL